ncbi:hypothetical protein BGX24_003679 [Mortierella sp. AD032]|nr:hypothetical protein BGX24_003679 [Mortierella sp. AD032]
MSIDAMTAHISSIRGKDFNPTVSFSCKGYALRRAIKTDGYRIQLLAFKLNELNCVKFRRLDEGKLLDPLTSTLGGTDHCLKEIRNVVKAPEDVKRLWDCDPKDIKILGIDLGQAFVVGASALLPSPTTATRPDGEEQGPIAETYLPLPTQFHNLSVSQKAVYQPTFKHRRWLEQRKEHAVEGQKHRSSNIKQSCATELNLETFYNVTLKKHRWDAKRARDQEFELVGKRLLELVGGTPGVKRDSNNKVIIGIGLGEFSSNSWLSSLHTEFCKYFVQLARSLNYMVVGGHLLHHKCPHYLQP